MTGEGCLAQAAGMMNRGASEFEKAPGRLVRCLVRGEDTVLPATGHQRGMGGRETKG